MFLTGSNNILKGIRFRLTLVYSTLFGLFLIVFAYIILTQNFKNAREDFDSSLLNYAIDLAEHLQVDEASLKIGFYLPPSEMRKAFPFILNQTYYAVREYEGRILNKSKKIFPFSEIPYDPLLPLEQDYTHRFFSFESEDLDFRAVNLKIRSDLGKEMILQVASPFKTVIERERSLLLITFTIVPLLIIASSFISYLIAGNTLNPIKDLTDAANMIAAKNLSLRVPEPRTGDEVEELSKTLNNLLERLEKSFRAQENFVANASHQLNTPLAIIKGELDVLESKARTLEDHQRFEKSLREELERLIELVKNLLLVSRVESGQESFTFHPLRLDDLLLTIVERLRKVAREKNVTIRFNIDESITNLEVLGEKQLLDSLFENIIDNAIKYSPDNSTVSLEIKSQDSKLEVWIRDHGPGISEEEIKLLISKRFSRGSSINLPGSGIGLPLAYQIAEHHKACIEYKRQPDGSLFIIRFA